MLLALALALAQETWPQFRGPLGSGLAPDARPPVEWSESRNIKWKVAIPGAGSATPAVWGEKIFLLTAVENGKVQRFDVLCLERASGRTLWRKTAVEAAPHEGKHDSNTYASASPSTDGKILLAPFGSRGIFAYDLEGNLKWAKDLGDMKIKIGFGEGASPALHGDAVVVPWDHEGDSFVVCLDAATGEERWRKSRDEGTTWTTPLVVDGQVIVNGQKRTRSYDLKTGAAIWECGGQVMNPIAVPIARDGIVYCATGYKGHAVVAIRLSSKGDVTDRPVWKRSDTGPYVASPLLYENLLYVTKERNGVLSCLDAATGEPRFGPERLPGIDTLYASLVGAAGRIYVAGREGTTLVLKHGPKLEILATNKLSEGIDATPVLVGKQIFLRGEKHLYCVEE
ncbi:MAG TPA: PQQ-binding-like beta-propeller repeat protein [Planctomycetota bacterium]